jgi:hypothetical protein
MNRINDEEAAAWMLWLCVAVGVGFPALAAIFHLLSL